MATLGNIFDGLDIDGLFTSTQRCLCGETRDLKPWPPTAELVCGPCHLRKAIDYANAREKGGAQ